MATARADRGWFWWKLQLDRSGESPISIRGLLRKIAERFSLALGDLRLLPRIDALLEAFDRPGGRDGYLTKRAHTKWLSRAESLLSQLQSSSEGAALPQEARDRIDRLRHLVQGKETAREERNREQVARHAAAHAKWFDSGQGYALTEQQRLAILHDEENALVVAGAGTGKTSTIVGKVGYLLQAGLARPDEILLLAFTKKASGEMEARIKELLEVNLRVQTFHKFGSGVVAETRGKSPSVSKLAEDELQLRLHVVASLRELLGTRLGSTAREFLAFHRYPYRPLESFQSLHEYFQYMLGHGVRTLKGEQVKSLEECLIADWLNTHGVEYRYEAPYQHETASIEFRRYNPDFFLPVYDIYIEHFGLDQRGYPAPFIDDPDKYLKGIAWKRALHQKHGTRLVETFSYMMRYGTLFPSLAQALERLGVKLLREPLATFDFFANKEVIDPLVSLFVSFLNSYKANQWEVAELRAAAEHFPDRARATTFLNAFEHVLARYEQALRESGEIDFNDMIRLATDAIKAGRYCSRFRYLIVDEFQDISRGRAKLMESLLAQVPDRRLFCVGDDWQSIYRFAGSDITLTTTFSDYFGFTRRTDLPQTYRFGKKLLDVTSRFVMRNPAQLRKQLVAESTQSLPALVIKSTGISDDPQRPPSASRGSALLEEVLAEIVAETPLARANVLILGRYNHSLPEPRTVPQHPRLELRFHTVHTAKGLEADYVVLLDVTAGRHGFPTEMVDDPLLSLVLAAGDSFPNAEERRLFYVAMTRARIRAYLLTDDCRRSAFVDELESEFYSGLVVRSDAARRVTACPSCTGGRLEVRDGSFGQYWRCSNSPFCKIKALPCPWCRVRSSLVRFARQFRCVERDCCKTARVCPSCGVGALIPRAGPYGEFTGCSEWRNEGPSCGYTERAPPKDDR